MLNLLKGRVAVITGAGRGAGRSHAIAMAKQGAKVVVNDLGGDPDGTGVSRALADEVVAEIRKDGGIAVANYDSVATPEGAQNIMRTAVENFGRVDVLVNNAGIFKSSLIFDMTDEEWDQVIKVHLYGTFYCTRAACRLMKEQGFGRIINVSSVAGMGIIGEANYSAAKEGMVGFTRTVARDTAQYGITCNAIRPGHWTRITVLAHALQARMQGLAKKESENRRGVMESRLPEDVSPMVVYLASEQAGHINGCIFEVRGNWVAIHADPPRIARTLIKKEGRWLPEELTELIPKTLSMGLRTLPMAPERILAPDARGWEWVAGQLKETGGFILPQWQ